jgi:hypothetical protein
MVLPVKTATATAAAMVNKMTIRKPSIVTTFNSNPQSSRQNSVDRLWITGGEHWRRGFVLRSC